MRLNRNIYVWVRGVVSPLLHALHAHVLFLSFLLFCQNCSYLLIKGKTLLHIHAYLYHLSKRCVCVCVRACVCVTCTLLCWLLCCMCNQSQTIYRPVGSGRTECAQHFPPLSSLSIDFKPSIQSPRRRGREGCWAVKKGCFSPLKFL